MLFVTQHQEISQWLTGWLTSTLESAPRETQQHRLQLLQGEERAAAPVLLTASEWLGINIIIEGSERRTIEALLSSSGFDGVVGWIVGHGAEKVSSFHLRGIVNNGICVRTRMNLLNGTRQGMFSC